MISLLKVYIWAGIEVHIGKEETNCGVKQIWALGFKTIAGDLKTWHIENIAMQRWKTNMISLHITAVKHYATIWTIKCSTCILTDKKGQDKDLTWHLQA